jgi:hypothetical protein
MHKPLQVTAAIRVGLVALLLAVTSVLAATPAGAGTTDVTARSRPGDALSPSRYPSVTAIARIFPEYRGGERIILGQRQLSVTSSDCQYLDVAATQPRKGRTAGYFGRGGQSTFFNGGTGVSVSLYDFRLPRRAQAALDDQRDTIGNCYGPNIDDDGYGVTYSSLEAPNLADDRFAYRYITHDANVGRDWFVTVWFRQGRFLGEARLQRDRNAPAATAGFALARSANRAAN